MLSLRTSGSGSVINKDIMFTPKNFNIIKENMLIKMAI